MFIHKWLVICPIALCFVIGNIKASEEQAKQEQKKDIAIALVHIPGIMEPEPSGAPYSKLLRHIAVNSEYVISSQFMPYNRAESLFNAGKIDCLFPVSKGQPDNSIVRHYSETINHVSVYLFSRDNAYKSFAEIAEETVIYLKGYSFSYWNMKDTDKVNLIEVGSQKSALKVLNSGRAKAYIDYYPDIKKAFTKQEFSTLKYDPGYPLMNSEDSFECSTTEKNSNFLQALNTKILTLKKSGKLQEILGQHYNHPGN